MNHFGIFAKYWQPGRVKTRLAATIGETAAAEIYRHFLATLIGRLSSAGDQRELSVAAAPPEPNAFRDLTGEDWNITLQAGSDLGERMQNFFEQSFAAGAERVVLIGSDSPTLTANDIEFAFEQLQTSSVVLGPTTDGGYYLVGAAQSTPPIFREIDWSTPNVWPQTIERLNAAGTNFRELPTVIDVDEHVDLIQLRDELATGAGDEFASALYDEVQRLVTLG